MRYKNREEFVSLNIKNYKKDGSSYLDIGFIGEYKKPFMHYEILKTMQNGDKLKGIDTNEKIYTMLQDDFIKNIHIKLSMKRSLCLIWI